MNEQDALRERRDYVLQQRHFIRDPDFIPSNPDVLATSPYEFIRSAGKWTTIAFSCWAIISGGMYLGYIIARTVIFGPDVW